jgi:hypothetical protein
MGPAIAAAGAFLAFPYGREVPSRTHSEGHAGLRKP